MSSNKVKSTFQEAIQFLEAAQNEMIRSEEDVVPQMVCSSSRKAVVGFLQSYLMKKGNSVPELSLDKLISECRNISPRFTDFELERMACRDEKDESKYCSDLMSVKTCLELAIEAKKIVEEPDKNLWPKSKVFK